MVDLTHNTIKQLFYQQIHDLTLHGKVGSFDMQFSDRWLR